MADKENGKLGLLPCIGIIVGGCIGSAIFSLSGQTIAMAGPASIVSWAIAALVLALYGMQVCELAVRYPQSGGIFVFPQKAISGRQGNFWALISAWGYIVSNIIAVAFSAVTIGNFMTYGFGLTADPLFTFLGINFTWTVVLALLATIFCIILNLMKITDAGKFNNLLVGALVVAMLIFIGFAFFGKRPDGTAAFTGAYFQNFFSTGMGVKGMFRAIPIAAVAYGSCVAISFMVGEVKNPNKTIPASLSIGLIIVMVLYLLMVTATVATCGFFLFEAAPFLQFAPQFGSILMDALVAYPWLAKLIALAALVALVTTMLVVLALNARAMQAVAGSKYLPKCFASENKNNVPGVATWVCGGIALLLCLCPAYTNSVLVNVGALFNVVSMAITCVALMIARKKTTLSADQYRAPLGNFAPIFTIVVLTVCYVIGGITTGAIITTVIVYAVAVADFYLFGDKKAN